MELLRDKIVDCFLTVISLTMCAITFKIIAVLFTIIQYLAGDTSTYKTLPGNVSFMAISILTLVHLCYSGHYFSQHVRHVSGQLRDLRLEVRGQEDMTQLQYLISTLERMETFDMGSWYCLSPNTLVSVVSFSVTYLVVLLQVGGQSTHLSP